MYDLDDEDEDVDFLHKVRETISTKNSGAPPPEAGEEMEFTSLDSPYARDGIVEKIIKGGAGLTKQEENLGDDFLETPWHIPDVDKASEYHSAQVYREGLATTSSVALTSDADLGSGVRLYFHFVKSLGVALVLLSTLSLPLLLFAYSGSAVTPEQRDSLRLYQFSLGNVGSAQPSLCQSTRPWLLTANNETCVSVVGVEFSTSEVSFVVTVCECLQVLVVLFVIWHLRRRLAQFSHPSATKEYVSLSNYTVYVTNLPPCVTEEEVVKHFSSLYQLERVDWRGRHPVDETRPVQYTGNTGDDIHKGSWVAECTFYRKIGAYLTRYKAKQDVLKNLYRNRAKVIRPIYLSILSIYGRSCELICFDSTRNR
jgi:hypothetical protein